MKIPLMAALAGLVFRFTVPTIAQQSNTPTLQQHISTASDVIGTGYWANAKPGNPYYLRLPNLTKAGNCLILGLSCPYFPGRSISITDDKSNTWASVQTVNNG
jgi:hypothetical protein